MRLTNALTAIRERHEDDTACELNLVRAINHAGELLVRAVADGVVTRVERAAIGRAQHVVTRLALRSLSYNREINAAYGALSAGRTSDLEETPVEEGRVYSAEVA